MTRSEAITELYALFGAPHNADINLNDCIMKYKKKNFSMDGFPVVWTKNFLRIYKFTLLGGGIRKCNVFNCNVKSFFLI